MKWSDNSSPNRPAVTGLMIKRFSLQSTLSFYHSLSSHGFPVPEERYKYWTPLERQAAIMFCEAGGKQEACGAQYDVTFLPSTKHYTSVFSTVLSLLLLCWAVTEWQAATLCYISDQRFLNVTCVGLQIYNSYKTRRSLKCLTTLIILVLFCTITYWNLDHVRKNNSHAHLT